MATVSGDEVTSLKSFSYGNIGYISLEISSIEIP